MRKLLLIGLLLGCSGKHADKAAPPAPPPRPVTGAPVAFHVTRVVPGDPGEVDVDAYNFSDKIVGQYMILLRYHDASGAVLKVKAGTPFEKDFDFWSMSGMHFLCAPKSWCSIELDHLPVPAKAATAEVLAKRVTALAADGVHFEPKPLFDLPGMAWPAAAK